MSRHRTGKGRFDPPRWSAWLSAGPRDLFSGEQGGPFGRKQQFDRGVFDPPEGRRSFGAFSPTGSLVNVFICGGLLGGFLLAGFIESPVFFIFAVPGAALEVWFIRIMISANRPPY